MAERIIETAFTIRSCLTKGVQEISGYRTSDRYFMEQLPRGWIVAHRIGVDVFFNRDQAVVAAKAKCKKRIAALKKQIEKLKTKEFA